MLSRISLGSAQFGLDYGIANSTGKVKKRELELIFKKALDCGINTIDTAIDYKDSESIIGSLNPLKFKILTKLPEIPKNLNNIGEWVKANINNSLEKLNVPSLDGLLLHRPSDLKKNKDLYSELRRLKDEGTVKKIGISIYSPSELDDLVPLYEFDLIQTPLNIFDRRIVDSGWLRRLSDLGIEIHSRSCFLQGLLLLKKHERPLFFNSWSDIFDEWDSFLLKSNYDPVGVCLKYPFSFKSINRVIIGVDSYKQFNQIIHNINNIDDISIPDVKSDDYKLINPSEWIFK